MPSCFWYQTAREVDFLVKNNNNFNSAWVYLCFPSELHPLCLLFQPPHTHKHVSANSDKSPLEVCQWLVISGPWRGCRPLRLREHCGLCTLGTKPVLWVVQEDLEEGHPSTRTPPCYLLNTSCQILSSSSQMLKFKKTLGFHQRRHCWCTSAHTVGEVKQEKKPCCHFCLFWGTVWKLFARPVDPAAARKHFLMRTTTVSEAHYTIPDKPASAEPSRGSNHILYLRIEVTYCRFDYRHMRHLLNKWIPELLFNFFYFLSLFGLRSWKIFPTGLQCGQQVGRNAARPSVHAGFHRDYQWWS